MQNVSLPFCSLALGKQTPSYELDLVNTQTGITIMREDLEILKN